jgi:hypothetical protein
MFQELSNDRKNATSHWILTPQIALWSFGSPPELHLPKWELPWECEGSLPHTFLHSRDHVIWLAGFLLAPHPCNPFALVANPKLGLRQEPWGVVDVMFHVVNIVCYSFLSIKFCVCTWVDLLFVIMVSELKLFDEKIERNLELENL